MTAYRTVTMIDSWFFRIKVGSSTCKSMFPYCCYLKFVYYSVCLYDASMASGYFSVAWNDFPSGSEVSNMLAKVQEML